MDRTVEIHLQGDARVATEDIMDLAREVAAFMAGQLGYPAAEVVVVGVRGRGGQPRARLRVEAE